MRVGTTDANWHASREQPSSYYDMCPITVPSSTPRHEATHDRAPNSRDEKRSSICVVIVKFNRKKKRRKERGLLRTRGRNKTKRTRWCFLPSFPSVAEHHQEAQRQHLCGEEPITLCDTDSGLVVNRRWLRYERRRAKTRNEVNKKKKITHACARAWPFEIISFRRRADVQSLFFFLNEWFDRNCPSVSCPCPLFMKNP
jgi:hypothetical protein